MLSEFLELKEGGNVCFFLKWFNINLKHLILLIYAQFLDKQNTIKEGNFFFLLLLKGNH
jgi:hypothetical protein